MFRGEYVRIDVNDWAIAELCFDNRNEQINRLGLRTILELEAATETLRAARGLRGVLVCSAKETFLADANAAELAALLTEPLEKIEAHTAHRNSVLNAFESLGLPIVTAINGAALGAGFEMALASDARVLVETGCVGLPAVAVGLTPALGGTVRLPRLTTMAVAIEWISAGKPQNGPRALSVGVVDALAPAEVLRERALNLVDSLFRSGKWRAQRELRQQGISPGMEIYQSARATLARGPAHQPAALAAVELMERSAGLSCDEALKLEHRTFAQIARTQAAASLVQAFINEQAIKQKLGTLAQSARPVQRAAVIGAGIMGGGIAYTSAVSGVPVVMKDISQNALDLGMAEAQRQIARQVDTGRMRSDDAENVLGSIHPTLEDAGFESADLVVEAVVEKMDVKKRVLMDIEQRVRPGAIVVSNTSSLSISGMAEVLSRLERFAGMHFFNPVPLMPLVEIIRGPRTSEQTIATVAGYARTMRKTPVVVRECPGFLVNRVLTPYLLGFLRAVRDGADFLEVDRVMEAFGWPMGPAYLQDVIGLDTLLHILRVISEGFADRMKITFPHCVELLVEHGRLGQKRGAGFYRYELDARGRPRKAVDDASAKLLASIQPDGVRPLADDELRERLMLPMIIESVRCLEEGIVETAAEVDMSMMMGLGFPRYAGGPLKLADWLGFDHIVARCDTYASLGPLYAPTERMRAAARSRRMFYPTGGAHSY